MWSTPCRWQAKRIRSFSRSSPFGWDGKIHPCGSRTYYSFCFTKQKNEPSDSPPYGFGHLYSFSVAKAYKFVKMFFDIFYLLFKNRLVRKTKNPPFWRVFAMRFLGLGVLFSQKAPQKRPLISCSGTLPGYGRARTPCCLFSRKRRSACTNPR